MKKLLLTALAVLVSYPCSLKAQSYGAMTDRYISPMKLPMTLSANFGELRPNHFHSGIDIKTGGVTGHNVYAVADGYISRVAVSPTGYGHVLYVTHPSLGTMSVYAHLDGFIPKIEKYVLDEQYRRRSFSVNLFPAYGLFKVSKGELIGYSGNTGSSGGPHLHFEIREGRTSSPVNIIERGYYKTTDDVPPAIVSVSLYRLDTISGVLIHNRVCEIPVIKDKNGNLKPERDTVEVNANGYLVIETNERKSGTNNIYGLYKLTVNRNEAPFFGFGVDKIEFSQTKYINALIAFDAKGGSRNDFVRTYIAPNNKLAIYTAKANNGIIYPTSIKGVEKIDITATDDSGNSSSVSFHIKRGTPTAPVIDSTLLTAKKIDWKTGGVVTDSLFRLSVPEGALYESVLLHSYAGDTLKGCVSRSVTIGDDNVRLHKNATLSFDCSTIAPELRKRALVVRITGGKAYSEGGRLSGTRIITQISRFGTFAMALDTEKPKVETTLDKTSAPTEDKVTYKITDDLSGVRWYRLEIDGVWVLLEADPKSSTYFCRLDKSPIKKNGGEHKATLRVVDGVGNVTTKENVFKW